MYFSLFPHFKQAKKNLIGIIIIFFVMSFFMLIDLGIEFLSFAYILIYVGAIAVMFLFVIVAVDPKYENQKELFEDTAVLAIFFNNVLLGLLYILIVRHSEKGVFINSEGLIIKNNSKFLQILDISLIEKKGEFLVLQKILDSN
jgi:NADH:ubiquinone oxidoreductase subunit 6 (subunit J)